MLVECVRLRRGGIKLDRAELEAPMRANLRVEGGVARLTTDPTSPPTVGDIFPPLEECRLHRIGRGGMVLHGQERPLVDRFRYGQAQPQAWWCRIVR